MGFDDIIMLLLGCIPAIAMFIVIIIGDIYETDKQKLVLFTLDVLTAIKKGTPGKEEFEKNINNIFQTRRVRKEAQEVLNVMYKEWLENDK